MTIRTPLVLVPLALTGLLSACAISGEDKSRSANIVGGTTATAFPEAVLVDMGGSACSGSVIAPRVVLTAGHCVYGVSGWNITAPFAGGQKASSKKGVLLDYYVGSDSVDPDKHDVGLVILSTEIKLAKYPIVAKKPIAFGNKGVNIGRIQDGSFSSTKLFVSKPLTMNDGKSYGYPLDYISSEVIEPGDSGGPVESGDGSDHTIIAVNSGAGGGTQVLARVDLVWDWIDKTVVANGGWGEGPPPPPPPVDPSTPGDEDGDGILDKDDFCSKTPKGEPVWAAGEWMGCAEGQWRDGGGATAADSDGDGISDAKDKCSKTPKGTAVWPFGEWIGCSAGQFRD